MAWRYHTDPGGDGVLHVWPEDDREHDTEAGTTCFCGPNFEFFENGNIVVMHRDELERLELV